MVINTKAVIADNIKKIYPNGKKAVDDISFTLEQGEVFGFLGTNGAGKTTIVKLFNGMLSPTEGVSKVFGIDPFVNPVQVHQFSGILTEHAQMYGNMTGLQNLVFFGAMFGINAVDSKDLALSLLETLELTDAKDRKLDTYSTGMRQRLSLARAMIHRPKILFLDEPTSGLDPESVLSVNNMIRSLAKNEGTTIFLCTHQLRYAQEICSSYGLISNGVMLAAGNLEKLRSMIFSGLTVSIKSDRFPKDISSIETLLYCPLSLRQIFSAKIIASLVLSQFVSLVSFAAMNLVVQTETWFITGSLMLPGISWLVLLLPVSPAISLVAITLIVRGSAKAKSVEEAQQRGTFLILPVVVLIIGQFGGIVVNAWLLLGLGILCAIVGLIILRRSSAKFHYERLLR